MPGILPMKVIKVGNNSQSRIAQACDRCRSKKIRCDGVRPCCTQCANVGFECKTSDKLSRRAFPRGYTESLEERVRALETEVKELKDLLDEKDEKIDVLSRIHSFSPPVQQKINPVQSPVVETSESTASDVIIHVQSDDSGLSTTRGFVDAFTSRLGEGKSNVSTRALTTAPATISPSTNQSIQTPPRLVSDQLINIFFQEWAPLYPVVHRPTILKAYEQYLANPEAVHENTHDFVQLNLIFGIAALASTSRTNQDPTFFEQNWVSTLESLSSDVSVRSLQCLILAQMYCMTKGDYQTLLRYRALAVGLCHQLRLHQSQKQTSNSLVCETRKKVFWSQYVLDRFSAALTGLPVLLREDDIRTEYPEDVDDENVTETGFLPTLPGESTRISGAIAFFVASRILNKALENVYPSDSQYEVYVSKMRAVSDELDGWVQNLAPHLRLEFSQDKPSTNVTSSRSPLLSLVYYFVRSLIHRPVVCFAEDQISSPSVLAVSDSSKHIIQILQLLDERRLCLSLSINRKELVLTCGLGLLWQNIGLKRDSKLVKEAQKLLAAVVCQLESESAPAATEFSTIANGLISLDGKRGSSRSQDMSAPSQKPSKSPKQSPTSKVRNSANITLQSPKAEMSRRATISGASPSMMHQPTRTPNRNSFGAPQSGPYNLPHAYPVTTVPHEHPRAMSCSAPSDVGAGPISVSDWEIVLSDMDRGYSNIFTGIYGGKECGEDNGPFASLTAEYSQKPEPVPMPPSQTDLQGLSPEAWSATSSRSDILPNQDLSSQSVLSYSDESLGSVDRGMPYGDMLLHTQDHAGVLDPFRGIMIPAVEDEIDEFGLASGWDRRLAV